MPYINNTKKTLFSSRRTSAAIKSYKGLVGLGTVDDVAVDNRAGEVVRWCE
jgi:hypothetical protein